MLDEFKESLDLAMEGVVTRHVENFLAKRPDAVAGSLILLSFNEVTKLLTDLDAEGSREMYRVMDEYGLRNHVSHEFTRIILKAACDTQRNFIQRTNIEEEGSYNFKKAEGISK